MYTTQGHAVGFWCKYHSRWCIAVRKMTDWRELENKIVEVQTRSGRKELHKIGGIVQVTKNIVLFEDQGKVSG